MESESESSRNNDELVTQSLIQELRDLRDSSEALLFSPTERLFGITSVVVVGGLTLGLRDKQPTVLVAIPFVLMLAYGYLLQMNIEMLNRAGHKRFLEELVNERLGSSAFMEEAGVAVWRQGGRLGRLGLSLLQAMLAIFLAVLIGIGYINALAHSATLHYSYIVGVSLALIMLILSFRDVLKAYGEGYERAKRLWTKALLK